VFALEIDFLDGISSPETILVRRSSAIIGSSDSAHVVIEGASASLSEVRVIRGLGREFSCQPVRRVGSSTNLASFIEGMYSGDTELRLGEVKAHITALDVDLQVAADESPDQAGIRIIRLALTRPSPVFPAVAVLGAMTAFCSFAKDTPLIIGRSRKCGLRLDASDVSAEHARIGIEGSRFWVEDLGSTNGTFVNGLRISGRHYLERVEAIGIGAEFRIAPIANKEDVVNLNSRRPESSEVNIDRVPYPCVVSNSDAVQPSRFELNGASVVTVGRDRANDIWIAADHVSRRHLELRFDTEGGLTINDSSSNGTYLHGQRLPRDSSVLVEPALTILDLCSGVILGVCYSPEDEETFLGVPVSAEGAKMSPELHKAESGGYSRPGGSGNASSSNLLRSVLD